jgi:phosphoenolpyruvate synthase/pyruvate phosphate dikinase
MNIVLLDEPAGQDVLSVGGKVANLSRLAGTHRVPPGFCLTTAAFQQWSDGGDDFRRSSGMRPRFRLS